MSSLRLCIFFAYGLVLAGIASLSHAQGSTDAGVPGYHYMAPTWKGVLNDGTTTYADSAEAACGGREIVMAGSNDAYCLKPLSNDCGYPCKPQIGAATLGCFDVSYLTSVAQGSSFVCRSAANACPAGSAVAAGGRCQCMGGTFFDGTSCKPPVMPAGAACPDLNARNAAGQCVPLPPKKEPCHTGCDRPDQIPNNVGNPITIGSGRKAESMTDYAASGISPLTFIRYYDSQNPFVAPQSNVSTLGNRWTHNFDNRIAYAGFSSIVMSRSDGRILYLTKNQPYMYGSWIGDVDSKETVALSKDVDTGGSVLMFLTESNLLEVYDYTTGRMIRMVYPNGLKLTLSYSGSLLTEVQDNFGRKLQLGYTGNKLTTLTDPTGQVTNYGYTGDELTSVTYPDGAQRKYQYTALTVGGVLQPSLLTDVIDENNNSFAHWTYDAATGLATSSQHSNGQELYTLAYTLGAGGVPSSVVVTTPLGVQSTYALTTTLGLNRATTETNSALNASRSQTFDANGNVASRTDFRGMTTTYVYGTKNLETKRVEASGTADARTISTTRYAYWNLPIAIAEPRKVTSFSPNGYNYSTCAPTTATVPSAQFTNQYDTKPIYVICRKTEQGTTDATGSLGVNATYAGTPRTWTWTYNEYGQVLTENGPRTDITDVTTYTYYSATDPVLGKRGNLATVTNPKGHITQIPDYDANGRPLTIIDSNGVTTSLTYDVRSRIKTRTISGEVTSYQYDPAGQLLKVTLPDSSYIAYTYDAAHRLTDVTDSLGNSIHYTLDAMGNRTKDEIKDPLGTLSQQTTRVYDALSRLQTLTGAGEQ